MDFSLSDKKLVNPLFEITEAYGGVVIVHGSADLYNCPLEFDRMARRFPKSAAYYGIIADSSGNGSLRLN